MTTVLWQSSWRPHVPPRHATFPTVRRGFSVSTRRSSLPLVHAVNFKKQLNMAANYKVLQWNEHPDTAMTKEFMENYQIEQLRIFPGVVKEELGPHLRSKKGVAKALKSMAIITDHGKAGDRKAGLKIGPKNDLNRIDKNSRKEMPDLVPYPDKKITLEDTNLYEALKYVRPGYLLIPSTPLPKDKKELPNNRIPSFDIIPIKQQKLTNRSISRFAFTHDHPRDHFIRLMGTIWTHFLKGEPVTAQCSFRPKVRQHGYDFDWIWNNCVHLRPEIIQRFMPSATRLALGPLTNGNEVTWLVVPSQNSIDYRARWDLRQSEQKNLLKAGKGILPLEERKRLKREIKLQLQAKRKGENDPAIIVTPMAMAVARLTIIRKINTAIFSYEKTFMRIRHYVRHYYGRGRFVNRLERDVCRRLHNMENAGTLKNTPKVAPEDRHKRARFVQFEASAGMQRGEDEELDVSNLDLAPLEGLRRESKNFDFGLGHKSRKVNTWTKNEVRHLKMKKTFEERMKSAEPVETDEKHDETDKKVAVEDEIESLKKRAQEDWEEDDPLSLPKSPKPAGSETHLEHGGKGKKESERKSPFDEMNQLRKTMKELARLGKGDEA